MRFTVRRPPSGEVSPCCHRPSGGDVACSVDVGVAPTCSAGLALEDRLALAVPGCDVPARGASLRRVRSRDLLDPTESLVLQPPHELTPATSADCAVEPTFLSDCRAGLLDGAARGTRHRPHVESLDPDYVEPSREVGAGFLDPVVTSVPLAGLHLRDRPFCFRAAVGTALGARLPLHRLTPSTKPPVLGARFSQLRTLLQIAGSFAPPLPVLLLLHCQIPHIPRIPAVRQQTLFLLRSRQQPEPGHIRTVTAPTDIRARGVFRTHRDLFCFRNEFRGHHSKEKP